MFCRQGSGMSSDGSMKHVYVREIDESANDSLAVIARQFGNPCRVLDVGTGVGALGRYLKDRGFTVEGITYSEEEARRAADGYDRLEVIDLERILPSSRFSEGTFDVIVCADILEHLRNAPDVLRDLRGLLSPRGRLLLSIPNATYMGVIFGLLGGRFQRTQEGLLDATHVNFFDRQGLEQLVENAGFRISNRLDVRKGLLESEFAGMDTLALPLHLRQYVQSLPDADVYQFVWDLSLSSATEGVSPPLPSRQDVVIVPQFDAQLFWDVGGGFDESSSIHARGVLTEDVQVLRFGVVLQSIPTWLRLDPSDRPGVFEFFSFKLYDGAGVELFSWLGDWSPDLRLNDCEILPDRGLNGGRLMRSTGSDPWVCLPACVDLQRTTCAELTMTAPQPYRDAAFLWAERHYAGEIANLERSVSQLNEKTRLLELERLGLLYRREELERHLAAMESSTSWRVTAGLRWLSRFVKNP